MVAILLRCHISPLLFVTVTIIEHLEMLIVNRVIDETLVLKHTYRAYYWRLYLEVLFPTREIFI
jgi:hypothetical protein